jgi:hypothetical protein
LKSEAGLAQKLKTLSEKLLKQKKAGGVVQVVESKALSSNLRTAKDKTRQKTHRKFSSPPC